MNQNIQNFKPRSSLLLHIKGMVTAIAMVTVIVACWYPLVTFNATEIELHGYQSISNMLDDLSGSQQQQIFNDRITDYLDDNKISFWEKDRLIQLHLTLTTERNIIKFSVKKQEIIKNFK